MNNKDIAKLKELLELVSETSTDVDVISDEIANIDSDLDNMEYNIRMLTDGVDEVRRELSGHINNYDVILRKLLRVHLLLDEVLKDNVCLCAKCDHETTI
jgi:archaellum component FlaC